MMLELKISAFNERQHPPSLPDNLLSVLLDTLRDDLRGLLKRYSTNQKTKTSVHRLKAAGSVWPEEEERGSVCVALYVYVCTLPGTAVGAPQGLPSQEERTLQGVAGAELVSISPKENKEE